MKTAGASTLKTQNVGLSLVVAGVLIASGALGMIGYMRERPMAAKVVGGPSTDRPVAGGVVGSADTWLQACTSPIKGRRVQLVGRRLVGITKHDSDRHGRYVFEVVGEACSIDAVYWRNRWDESGLAVLQSNDFGGEVVIEGRMGEYKGRSQINVYSLKRLAE